MLLSNLVPTRTFLISSALGGVPKISPKVSFNEEIPDFSGFEGTHLAVDENSDEMDSENFDKAKQPQAGGFNPFANFHAITPDEIRKAAAARPTKPKHPTESLPPPMAKPVPAPPGGKRVPPPPEKNIPSACYYMFRIFHVTLDGSGTYSKSLHNHFYLFSY